MRDKILYEEGYKKPYLEIKKHLLPKCAHLTEGFKCVEARIMKGGVIERDKTRLEFQDIRIYLKEQVD